MEYVRSSTNKNNEILKIGFTNEHSSSKQHPLITITLSNLILAVYTIEVYNIQ